MVLVKGYEFIATICYYWLFLKFICSAQLRILSKEVRPCSNRHMPLWQMPNDVTYSTAATVQAEGELRRTQSSADDDVSTKRLKTYSS